MSHDVAAPASVRKADFSNPLAVAIVLALVTALSMTMMSWVVLTTVRTEQLNQAEELLRSELVSAKYQVQSYLQSIARDLQIVASSKISNIILTEFEAGFSELNGFALQYLQAAYITDNPNPTGRKQALIQANDGSQYSDVHGQYHDWLSQLSESYEYYDLFLVSASGDVLYTVYKEDDFASNLIDGKYKESELSTAFYTLRDDSRRRSAVFRDFNPYSPSGDVPAAFMGSPIIFDGEFQGALIAQLRVEPFNQLLRQSRVSGSGPETYLVGPDNFLRATSIANANETVKRLNIDSASVSAALANKTGILQTTDYRGVRVLSAYAPLHWNNLTWAALVELDIEVINKPLVKLRQRLLFLGIICVFLAFLAGWLLADHRPEMSNEKSAMRY